MSPHVGLTPSATRRREPQSFSLFSQFSGRVEEPESSSLEVKEYSMLKLDISPAGCSGPEGRQLNLTVIIYPSHMSIEFYMYINIYAYLTFFLLSGWGYQRQELIPP